MNKGRIAGGVNVLTIMANAAIEANDTTSRIGKILNSNPAKNDSPIRTIPIGITLGLFIIFVRIYVLRETAVASKE